MWKLKGCPRCGGDLFVDQDQSGWHAMCIQCGHRSYLQSIVDAREKVNKGNPRQAARSARVK